MTRGFVTIATGNKRYYKAAANLLDSYRHFAADPMPFAIICDRPNKFTAKFDEVIILKEPRFSYLDKLSLPEYVPYDETIFIESDCLAYRDINVFWQYFEGAADFSVFGFSCPTTHRGAWFIKEDVGDFGDEINFIPEFTGHVYFVRKTEGALRFHNTCVEILERYDDFTFRSFSNPADEPIIALAMAVHGFRPVNADLAPICFYSFATYFKADISKGVAQYISSVEPQHPKPRDACLVHWVSPNISKPIYKREVARLRHAMHDDAETKAWAEYVGAVVSTTAKELTKKALAKVGLLETARSSRRRISSMLKDLPGPARR